MKRAVVDKILPFLAYAYIMHNLVCGTLWTWRILIGPLNLEVAAFEGTVTWADSVNYSIFGLFSSGGKYLHKSIYFLNTLFCIIKQVF